MATVYLTLGPRDAVLPASNPAAFVTFDGTNFPVEGLAFDTTTQETVYFPFRALSYGSGNLTVRLRWYADTASANGVVFGCSLAAITPDTDSQDIETKSFATETTGSDTHLGTTGQRLHNMTVTVSNLDSVAADDWCVLRLRRVPSDGSDTMTGDCIVVECSIEYSDT